MTNPYIWSVKRVLINITLILVFLCSASAGQLLKLPILVSHYLEHEHRDHDIGFIQFLSMHYWGEDANDNDHDRDMQLPFKSSPNHCCNQLPSLPVTTGPVIRQFAVSTNHEFALLNELNFVNPSLSSLFRPPRV